MKKMISSPEPSKQPSPEATPRKAMQGSWRSIGKKMLALVLLLSLLPLAVLSLVVRLSVQEQANTMNKGAATVSTEMKEMAGQEVANLAHVTIYNIEDYLRVHLVEAYWTARSREVVEAAKNAEIKAEVMGYTAMDAAKLERLMFGYPSLSDDPYLVYALKGLTQRLAAFREVIFTEKHGYNVAYTSPTTNVHPGGSEVVERGVGQGVLPRPGGLRPRGRGVRHGSGGAHRGQQRAALGGAQDGAGPQQDPRAGEGGGRAPAKLRGGALFPFRSSFWPIRSSPWMTLPITRESSTCSRKSGSLPSRR